MRVIPRDTSGEFPPGTWRAITRDGERGANFACPRCGFRGGLGHNTNHAIAPDGTVSPSVVCRTPSERDLTHLRQAYEKQLAIYQADEAAAAALLKVGETPRDESLDAAQHAALTAVCLAILNLDEALTRE